MTSYNLAPDGVFETIQGEGALCGLPMIFIRLAGCSVGCDGCDTNYSVKRRMSLSEIVIDVTHMRGNIEWVHITGGEPSDQKIGELIDVLHDEGMSVSLSTSGIRTMAEIDTWVDFLSISPHPPLSSWRQRHGEQVNFVPGLGGLSLKDITPQIIEECLDNFTYRYVTPMSDSSGKLLNLQECLMWVKEHAGWRLGIQAHKTWRVL